MASHRNVGNDIVYLNRLGVSLLLRGLSMDMCWQRQISGMVPDSLAAWLWQFCYYNAHNIVALDSSQFTYFLRPANFVMTCEGFAFSSWRPSINFEGANQPLSLAEGFYATSLG